MRDQLVETPSQGLDLSSAQLSYILYYNHVHYRPFVP